MLTLPCTPADLIQEVIVPALALFPVGYDSPGARCQLVAIAKQESDLQHVRQLNGPARSLWQFERIGVLGVTQNHKVDDLAAIACREAKIACSADLIMRRIEVDHLLACRLARLNLWVDKHALPHPSRAQEQYAFDYYVRTWRPGACVDPDTHPSKFPPGSEAYAKQARRREDARERWHRSWALAVEAAS